MTNADLVIQDMLSECGYFIILCQKMPAKVGRWIKPIFCSADCSWIPNWWNNQDCAPDFKSVLILHQKRTVLPKNWNFQVQIFYLIIDEKNPGNGIIYKQTIKMLRLWIYKWYHILNNILLHVLVSKGFKLSCFVNIFSVSTSICF